MRKALWKLAGVVAGASPAVAEWRQARTNHFNLAIDDTEDGARDVARRLERFDAAEPLHSHRRRQENAPDNPLV